MAIFWKALCSTMLLAQAAAGWALLPQQVAERTWVVEGHLEEFSEQNGGHIGNLAFIATGQGVVLIDSGSTRAFAETLKRNITALTGEPVRWVINTHHHPDHTFGNAAFPEASVLALEATRDAFRRDAPVFAQTLQTRLGAAFDGTVPREPDRLVQAGEITLGGRLLQLHAFSGHSGADLAVFDTATGVLFAGDLLFWQRAPTTPHSPDLQQWLAELDQLAALPARLLVPGHGPVSRDDAPIRQTRAWLQWLDALLREGVERGATENELRQTALPEALRGLALARYELTRSITHFYQRYEDAAWQD